MNQNLLNRFDEALRAWSENEPEMTAQKAADRVVERTYLDTRREVRALPFPGFAAAAAGVILVIAVTWAVLLRPEPSTPASEIALPPLDDHIVLVWLDQETPLYLTVATPATQGDS